MTLSYSRSNWRSTYLFLLLLLRALGCLDFLLGFMERGQDSGKEARALGSVLLLRILSLKRR